MVQTFINQNTATSTIYKNNSAEMRLSSFIKTTINENDCRKIENIPATELNEIMCKFFMTAKKVNKSSITKLGELYQPDSLSSFQHAWQRLLTSRGSTVNLKTDKEFVTSRKVLAARRKMLTKSGLGNKPCATRPLTGYEVDLLYSNRYFGTHAPLPLQRNIWWKITISFGHRARDESRKLKFGDIKLGYDSETFQHYIEWDKERGSKTRTGESSNSHQRSFNPRAYETNDDRCPVMIYQQFLRHRPKASLTPDSPFFLQMIPQDKIKNEEWYLNRPLGRNELGEFLSQTSNIIGSSSSSSRSKVSNHSARKTSITNLLDSNKNSLHVIQLSGHKNTESLNQYHVASNDTQRLMSNILNKNKNCDDKIDFSVSRSICSGGKDKSTPDEPSPCSSKQQQISTISSSNSSKEPNNINSGKQISFEASNMTLNSSTTRSTEDTVGSLFQGATLSNNVFNISIVNKFNNKSPPKKRRKYVIYDSDSE